MNRYLLTSGDQGAEAPWSILEVLECWQCYTKRVRGSRWGRDNRA